MLMSINHGTMLLTNNKDRVVFNSIEQALIFFQNQLTAYSKSINLLKIFNKLLDDLNNRQFSKYDNESRSIEIINNSLSILYANLVTVMSTVSLSKQLFNLSINENTVCGYNININYMIKNNKQKIRYKINSMRLQINTKLKINMIKWVHNNSHNIPESVIFIGEKLDTSTDIRTSICNYINSVNLAIDKLKVYELAYINLINNFVKTTLCNES